MAAEPFAIRIHETGGPDVLRSEPVEIGEPGPGEVRLRHEAIGLNFIDTYFRKGLYDVPLPSGLGNEAAGVVEAVGDGVGDFQPGDRAGYFTGPPGAYATHRLIAADRLVSLPGRISFEQAAAALLKGCTAEYLIERCARVEAGQWILVHAAAGGVGSIAVQWLKAIGARVIAHAGSAPKAELASELGADHALSCPLESLAAEVRRLTGGEGVQVALDGVGKASWDASLGSLAKRGLMVSYGNASGPVPAISPIELMKRGSIFLTRPTLGDYCTATHDMRSCAARLFEMMQAGSVRVEIGHRFPLADADDAHRALEARETTGSTILIPRPRPI
jgi:NADPH2:quinone reductase